MPEVLRKRGREAEALPDSTDVRESKRFNGEETDLFLHLSVLDKTLAAAEDEADYTEDFLSGVMERLDEEISATCSNFYNPISWDRSLALDISSGHEGQILLSDSGIDLCYLLEASDDELGIPSSSVVDSKDEFCQSTTVVDSKDEFCQSTKETMTIEGLSENPALKCEGENWDFEDDFENYQQLPTFEDGWDASQVQDDMIRDFTNQGMSFDGHFSAAWTNEIARCL